MIGFLRVVLILAGVICVAGSLGGETWRDRIQYGGQAIAYIIVAVALPKLVG